MDLQIHRCTIAIFSHNVPPILILYIKILVGIWNLIIMKTFTDLVTLRNRLWNLWVSANRTSLCYLCNFFWFVHFYGFFSIKKCGLSKKHNKTITVFHYYQLLSRVIYILAHLGLIRFFNFLFKARVFLRLSSCFFNPYNLNRIELFD